MSTSLTGRWRAGCRRPIPNPRLGEGAVPLWAQLDAWQREVFDALRAYPAGVKAKEPGSLHAVVVVPTLGARLAHMAQDATQQSLAMVGKVIIVAIDRRAVLAGLTDALAAAAIPNIRAQTPTQVAPEAVGYFRSRLALPRRWRPGPVRLLAGQGVGDSPPRSRSTTGGLHPVVQGLSAY
jgi:hypothetical protein